MSQLDPLLFLKKKLQNAILQLQSDQVLQQMRNDHTLAQFKREHIKQIIKEELHMQTELEALAEQMSELKDQIFQKDDLISQIRQEYTLEIQNIERDWERYRSKTENDKKLQEEKYLREIQALAQKSKNNTVQNKNLKHQIEKLRKENESLKEDRFKLEENKSVLEEQTIRLKKLLKQKNEEIMSKNLQLEQKRETQIDNYEEIIEKMKKDMQYIRECWQKKCYAIEAELKEENNMLVLHYEQKMRKELKEYAENLKLGNSVIITDSQQIIAKRMEKVQQEYAEQMTKIEEEMSEISNVYLKTKEQIEEKELLIKQLQDNCKLQERQREKIIHQNQLKNSSLIHQAITLKQAQKRMQIQVKEERQRIQELSKQKQAFQGQVSSLRKKINQRSLENDQLIREIQSQKSKISKLSHFFEEANVQVQNLKKIVLGKDQTLNSKQFQLQATKRQKNVLQSSLQSLKQANQKLSLLLRNQRQKAKKLTQVTDKLHLAIRKFKKDNEILREEVKCSFGILKTKFTIEMQQILDYAVRNREHIQRRNKLKMNELIDEMQAKEKELIENLASEKQQLKIELEQSLQGLQKQVTQLQKSRNMLKDSQKERKDLIQDLHKEKLMVSKLEEKIDNNAGIYQNTINRLQKDIGRSLTLFYNKWSQNIGHLQGQLELKEAKIKMCVEKMDQLIQQIEQNKRRADWGQEEVKKYRKKYEQVRKERDAKIESLLKQLQQEGKHRLNLQRQLKQVRLSIMRGTSNSNINFSFNDREKDHNVISSFKNSGVATKQDYNHQREKQLSQIREMIAKTYKVVGEPPEKDLTKNVSRKHLF